jgi:hypothetical protein
MGKKVEIDVGNSPADYVTGNSRKNPLIVKTTAVSKSNRQVTTGKMSVEASCRKYLDALSTRLAFYYHYKLKCKAGPTIGDVLEAIQVSKKDPTPKWSFVLEPYTYELSDENGDICKINAGDPRLATPLPLLFTDDEWDKLRVLDKSTYNRVHDAQLPQLSNGKPYIINPHSNFNNEMISFLKALESKLVLMI